MQSVSGALVINSFVILGIGLFKIKNHLESNKAIGKANRCMMQLHAVCVVFAVSAGIMLYTNYYQYLSNYNWNDEQKRERIVNIHIAVVFFETAAELFAALIFYEPNKKETALSESQSDISK